MSTNQTEIAYAWWIMIHLNWQTHHVINSDVTPLQNINMRVSAFYGKEFNKEHIEGIQLYEILSKSDEDRGCQSNLEEIEFIPIKHFTNRNRRAIQRYGLECAVGGCITNSQYQPNGNQMCMINYESQRAANDACDKYHCDVIVSYTEKQLINGRWQQQGKSK